MEIGRVAIDRRHTMTIPMEWVWRSLTYLRKQPMRIAAQKQAPQMQPTASDAM
jgi:hypothetical protein